MTPKEPGDFRERVERDTIRGYNLLIQFIYSSLFLVVMVSSIRALSSISTDIGEHTQSPE
jgi:hypothetical protein